MFGLTIEKLLLIGLVAALIVGPRRLPEYAEKLADLVHAMKRILRGVEDRVRDEVGDEFDDIDWQKLDPRQYDPKRIIRRALLDEEEEMLFRPPPVVRDPPRPRRPNRAERARASGLPVESAEAAPGTEPAGFVE
ncbi:twin-arginine translocase TatA/TatE family subunit [Microbacterium sp. 2MCAF23]|uniref:twin-arginine translocase TatA/TatE family subunit n=1 Tax=Microbacterium sp. 2MCAF23 TaxID=3232985 RepID=UPI003F9BACD3